MLGRGSIAACVAALAVGGAAVISTSSAGAKPATIDQVTSGSVSCSMTSKAKIAPKLKNDWSQAAHSSDIPAVAALPDTVFADQAPTTVNATAKTISCSGTVTDGVTTAAITSIKLTLRQVSNAVDNPPLSPGATCSNLLAGTSPEDQAATYAMDLTFKGAGAKIAPTTITGSTITPGGGLGFVIAGGTITGSFAGGSASSQAYIDGDTLAAVTAAPATSSAPVPTSTKCEAALKIKSKTKKGVTTTPAQLKKPKGMNKIVFGYNLLAPNDPSRITISVP
jgi:hypothetical protein